MLRLSRAVTVLMAFWGVAPALADGMDPPPAELADAVADIDRGAYQRAVSQLREVLETDPRNADAYAYLGFSYRKMKRYEPALAAYTTALELDPDHKGALEYLGELYVETGKLDQARQLLGRLAALCPAGCEEHDELQAAIAQVDGQ